MWCWLTGHFAALLSPPSSGEWLSVAHTSTCCHNNCTIQLSNGWADTPHITVNIHMQQVCALSLLLTGQLQDVNPWWRLKILPRGSRANSSDRMKKSVGTCWDISSQLRRPTPVTQPMCWEEILTFPAALSCLSIFPSHWFFWAVRWCTQDPHAPLSNSNNKNAEYRISEHDWHEQMSHSLLYQML